MAGNVMIKMMKHLKVTDKFVNKKKKDQTKTTLSKTIHNRMMEFKETKKKIDGCGENTKNDVRRWRRRRRTKTKTKTKTKQKQKQKQKQKILRRIRSKEDD